MLDRILITLHLALVLRWSYARFKHTYICLTALSILLLNTLTGQSTQIQWHTASPSRAIPSDSTGERSRLRKQPFILELKPIILYSSLHTWGPGTRW